MSPLILTLFVVSVVFVLNFVYNLHLAGREKKRLVTPLIRRFEEDLVYLFVYPMSHTSINPSPFCLKVLFFLRYHRIKYKLVESLNCSVEGKKPFIELNGIQVADSDLIIEHLTEKFCLKPVENVIARNVSFLIGRMMDKSTATLNLYSKLKFHYSEFISDHCGPRTYWFTQLFVGLFSYAKYWAQVKADGTGFESAYEVERKLRADLRVLDFFLAANKFTCGREPGPGDFAAFAHVCAAYNTAYAHPLKRVVDADCPNVRRFHDTVVREYFADYADDLLIM